MTGWIKNTGTPPRAPRGKDEPMVKVRLRVVTRLTAEANEWRPVSYWRNWRIENSGGDIVEYLLRQ